ncbi:MAG: hypothetical protein TREMPRED_001621 [Tremellales sp. Tagirdzhanova-0007]|nr:MAG: hypothetical protein TREMPRED_001621 [Tremellales sp. Tagirdzhanova-0007]
MDPRPILSSATDLERRRLESTVDQDLHSLSLASLISNSESATSSHPHSFSSLLSVEYPRGLSGVGPHGTPRAATRDLSINTKSGESPLSTVGHHVSAMTLADGIFARKGGRGKVDRDDDEWDPERSLGRLVGELGRVMSDRISPRPISPFSPPRSPRSPSPRPSLLGGSNPNLSFTLNRNDPLPSPPVSRSNSGSGSSADHTITATNAVKPKQDTGSRVSSAARELGNDIKARRVLGQSTSHNVQSQTPAPRHVKEKSRVRALQDENRRASAPGRVEQSEDITGLTGLMETPAKGGEFGACGKNGDFGGDAGGTIKQTLATLHARLRALETENSLCRRRVRELEGELERAKVEVEEAKRDGEHRLREVVGEKSALEGLVNSLRSHLARLTIELEQNKAIVSELRMTQHPRSPPRSGDDVSVHTELATLRREVERLGKEVARFGGIVEEGLETRRQARGERTIRKEAEETRIGDEAERLSERRDEVERARRDVEKRQRKIEVPVTILAPSKLRQGLHTVAATQPQLMPPTAQPPTRIVPPRAHRPTPPASEDGNESPTPASRTSSSRHSKETHRGEGPSSPFPSIRDEDEGDFFAALEDRVPVPALKPALAPARPSAWSKEFTHAPISAPEKLRSASHFADTDARVLPPQTVLSRVLRELEDDFAHYKAIYAELAESYKAFDAASAVVKRKVLAQHLREVIDTLEQKADQIASLYELLRFKDKTDPQIGDSHVRDVKKSVPDILRMVRESLGEDALRRLEDDGVGRRSRRAM